jgi:HEAT repeat protein
VTTLEEQLRASQAKLANRPNGLTGYAHTAIRADETVARPNRPQTPVEPTVAARPSRRGTPQGEPQDDLAAPTRLNQAKPVASPTVEAAVERFQKYLDEMKAAGGQVRWPRLREVASDLQAMGESGITALLRSLSNGATSDERRAAAQLLGEIGATQALPYLQGILENDNDVLLRRAAASAMRRLDSPDAVPLMQAIMANPNEDRFVRLSAAYGLAQQGNTNGIVGLEQLFNEAALDGRGRDMAFRALNSLNDTRALPFMRQLAVSNAEVGFRLGAIRFLGLQGDSQSLGSLQQIMQSSNEQPSIRDAATQAHAMIAGR